MPKPSPGYWLRQIESALRTGVMKADLELWREYWKDLPEEAKELIRKNVKGKPKKAVENGK